MLISLTWRLPKRLRRKPLEKILMDVPFESTFPSQRAPLDQEEGVAEAAEVLVGEAPLALEEVEVLRALETLLAALALVRAPKVSLEEEEEEEEDLEVISLFGF
jgi:hypothetical protein